MKIDDDTLLSAFLDDELDAADRMAMAWSVESSPDQAGRLIDLAATRDLVAGLGRPAAPLDLAPGLVARLEVRRPMRRRVASRLASLTLAGGFVSLAASLLGAMFFVYRATHDLDRPTLVALIPKATPSNPPKPNPGPAPSPDRPPLLARLTAPAPTVLTPVEAVPARLDPGSIHRERVDRERIAGMLARPDVHRILIVTDVIDAGERIKALIQKDVRKIPDFGRITVSQGIVIDPRHPDEADVFALVLDGRESEPFLGKLAKAFPKTNVVVEPSPDPTLLTQLPEVGQAVVMPGLSPNSADLPLVLAANDDAPRLRSSRDPGTGPFVMPDMEAIVGLDDQPAIQDPDGDAPRGAPTRFPTSPDPATYLVWVTRPTARR